MTSSNYYANWLCVTIILILCGCESIPDKVAHPLPASLPVDKELDDIISIENLGNDLSSEIGIPDTLSLHSTITKDNDELEFQYGNFTQIEIDDKGNTYVLIFNSNKLKVFGEGGDYLYEIGSAGKGPGEFLAAYDFTFSEDFQDLYIVDAGFKVEKFILRENRYVYDRTLSHSVNGTTQICLLNGALYMTGFDVDSEKKNNTIYKGFIHKIDTSSFEIKESFGPIYQSYSGNPYLTSRLSETFIACNRESEMIVASLYNFGYFYGYDENGNQKWISKIEGYKYPIFEELGINTNNPSRRYSLGRESNIISQLISTDSKYILLSVLCAKWDPETKKYLRDCNPINLAVDTTTGELAYIGSSNTVYNSFSNGYISTTILEDDTIDGNISVQLYKHTH